MSEKEGKITVEIKRGSIWIYPYKVSYYNKKANTVVGTCPELDRYISIYNFKIRRYVIPIKVYDSKHHILKLPKGIGLEHIESFLSSKYIQYEIVDNSNIYIKPRKGGISVPLNDSAKPNNKWQEKAIAFLTTKNAHTDISQKLLTLDTGFGKTFCAIYSICKLDTPTIIISPNLSQQWEREIKTHSKAFPYEIYHIKGSNSIKKLYKKKVHRESFYLASTQTLISLMESHGAEKLNELYNLLGIGNVIIDEVHIQLSANMYIITNSDVENMFYLTATPGRSKFNEDLLFRRLFLNVPAFGYETHFIKTHYNIRLIDYDTRASEYDERKCLTSEGFNAIKYFDYIIGDIKKRLYIFGIIMLLSEKILEADADAKILVFLPGLEHIELFRKLFVTSRGTGTGNYTSAIKSKEDKIAQLSNNIIFTTLVSGSTGLDLKNLRALFVLTPFSSKILARQVLGRLRFIEGKEVYLYDFLDRSFSHMNLQREKRMFIYGPRSKKIQKMFCSYETIKNEVKGHFNITI